MKSKLFICIIFLSAFSFLCAESHTEYSLAGTLDSLTPQISISTPVEGLEYMAGSDLSFEFTVSDLHLPAEPATPVSIQITADNDLLEQFSADYPVELDENYVYVWNVPTLIASDVYFTITATDSYGNEAQLESGHFSINQNIFYGDINNDGDVCSYDASLILQYVVNYDPLPEDPRPWMAWRQMRADVDLDNEILACDAAYILQYIVGTVAELPVTNR